MRKQQKIINLFNDVHISSIKQVFSIANEDDLDQCWSYFNQNETYTNSDIEKFITVFYEYSNQQIIQFPETFFELILENAEDYYYFTIWNPAVAESFARFIDKQPCNYMSDDKKITIKLKRSKVKPKIVQTAAEDQKNQRLIAAINSKENATANIPAYTFILNDDLQELLTLCDDMQDLILSAQRHGFVDDLFIRFRSCFSLFALELRHYNELASVADTITNFSALINTHQDNFSSMSRDEILLIEGFINNITTWINTLFIKGGAELTFMDSSLQADYETISMLFAPQSDECSIEEENLDDIFDF